MQYFLIIVFLERLRTGTLFMLGLRVILLSRTLLALFVRCFIRLYRITIIRLFSLRGVLSAVRRLPFSGCQALGYGVQTQSRHLDYVSKTYGVASHNTIIFEDRARVVDMYRSRGFTVFQVADGKY